MAGLPHLLDDEQMDEVKRQACCQLFRQGLQLQLCGFGPFIFMVEWLGGGLHTGVVEGYHTTNVPGYERWVELDDHGHAGFFLIPYDEFVYDPTEHRHYRDYIKIRRGA